MRITQCINILSEIPSYSEAFFLLRNAIVLITSISETGISCIASTSFTFDFSNSCKALCKLKYLLFKFSAIFIKNLLKIFTNSVVSVIRPASEFILVTETYNWDLPVETFIISHAIFTLFEEEKKKQASQEKLQDVWVFHYSTSLFKFCTFHLKYLLLPPCLSNLQQSKHWLRPFNLHICPNCAILNKMNFNRCLTQHYITISGGGGRK